jgi:hypothetical protein
MSLLLENSSFISWYSWKKKLGDFLLKLTVFVQVVQWLKINCFISLTERQDNDTPQPFELSTYTGLSE